MATAAPTVPGAPGTAIETPIINAPGPTESNDPFAAQREGGNDPFASGQKGPDEALDLEEGSQGLSPVQAGTKVRRQSKEWDASKVPPSQFQKRKGSVYATPSSRDSHTSSGDRDKAYFEKLKEKGWNILKKK
ncbi:hypothetical protein EJ08DRAFT_698768 [Tothia fuscella]|uniref:Uncharacterized protein n=1 Tax=Tothia fuscella TaxID=1048955 RepID=A0A9P4TXL8_9PEZI|nr:hypothetical protein EJ08DRAFT_698768 [Tothia fuscella]